MKQMKKRKGFTLIELLVVVTIILILVALIAPHIGTHVRHGVRSW